MSSFEEQLALFQKNVLALPVVQEFFRLREAILKDDQLMTLEQGYQHHQKLMAKCINDEEKYRFHKQAFETQKASFESHPLVNNYLVVKAEVEALLTQIKTILE